MAHCVRQGKRNCRRGCGAPSRECPSWWMGVIVATGMMPQMHVQLEPLWEAFACETYRSALASLAQEVGFHRNNIPQLADISDYLTVSISLAHMLLTGRSSLTPLIAGKDRLFHSARWRAPQRPRLFERPCISCLLFDAVHSSRVAAAVHTGARHLP